jgi:hypothetical protein
MPGYFKLCHDLTSIVVFISVCTVFICLGAFASSRKVRTSFLSACLHVPTRLPLDGFPLNLILGTFMKICWEKLKIWFMSNQNIGHFTWKPKYVLLLTKKSFSQKNTTMYPIMFYCCRPHKFAIQAYFFAALIIFVLLTVTCNLTKRTERIIGFPLQQWLRELTTLLCVHSLSCLSLVTEMCLLLALTVR